MRIQRTYMAVLGSDLNNEMLIGFENLARLLRDTIHHTCIRKMTKKDIFFHPPGFKIDGIYFTSEMEEMRKFIS